MSLYRSDRGAISLSDLFLAGISALFVGALAVPFMLTQQSDMNRKSAELDARSIATEVELFLQSNRDLNISDPIIISYSSATQQLTIAAPSAPVESTVRRIQISNGSALPAAGAGDLQFANILVSNSKYCIAIDNFGQRAYHNQNGPARSCAE
jgi:hypothetical protein